MGIRIVGQEAEAVACLYDSVTGLAFGPIFESVVEVEEFLTHWYGDSEPDLRVLGSARVAELVSQYRDEKAQEEREQLDREVNRG